LSESVKIANLWKREQKFINLIIEMEARGVGVDLEMCRREIAIGESRMFNIRKDTKSDPGSSKELKKLLIDGLGLPVVKRTAKGAPSFDKFAMEEYDEMLEHRNSPLAKQIFEYRGWQKSSGYYRSYLDLVSAATGRIHTTYWINGTLTSRLSSSKPNLQQIPKSQEDPTKKPWNNRMKQVFLPLGHNGMFIPANFDWNNEPYCLLNVDFGQIEFRLAAAYSGEQVLLDAFNDPSRHVFKEMATALNRDYNQCKTFTYATLYGAQPKKIGQILGLEEEDAMQFGDDFHNRYPKLVYFAEKVNDTARRRGYIKLWSGRRRHFVEDKEWRKAFNSLLQGGGAELVKSAMIRVKERVDDNYNYRMNLQVHDSIIGETRLSKVDEIREAVIAAMIDVEQEYDFGVKFTAEADFWGPPLDLAA
jgi:DNA polymerase-1